jgi:hypothetical protein
VCIIILIFMYVPCILCMVLFQPTMHNTYIFFYINNIYILMTPTCSVLTTPAHRQHEHMVSPSYEGGPKNNRDLNVVHELEVVARCAASCRESTQYTSSLPLGVGLG